MVAVAGAHLACGPEAGGEPERRLVIARAVSTGGLDPGFIREPATIVDNLFDTLVRRDRDMRLVPGLATEWSAINDTTWRFRLRAGVRFHNEEPFDASAVKFTIDRVLDAGNVAPTISYIRTIDRVEVVDDLTVDVITRGPDPLVPARMSRYPTYVVPPGYIAQVGAEEFARQPVGTGPYRFEEWVRDDHLTLGANGDYWRGTPPIEWVTWRPIPDDTARVAALLAGEVDIIEAVPVDQVALIERDPGAVLERVEHGGLIVYLGLRTETPPLDRAEVRRAISLAIDRRTIVERILRGYATPAASQVGPHDFGHLPLEAHPYDPDGARRLLARAGVAGGFTLRMQATRRYLKGSEVGQVVAEQLAAVGITVELEIPEWSVYIQQVPAGRQAPLYLLGWGSTQTMDADAALYPILRSGEPYSTVSIPTLDDLLERARREMDPEARSQLYHEVQRLADHEVPVVTLYHEDALLGRGSHVVWQGRADARIPVYDIRLD